MSSSNQNLLDKKSEKVSGYIPQPGTQEEVVDGKRKQTYVEDITPPDVREAIEQSEANYLSSYTAGSFVSHMLSSFLMLAVLSIGIESSLPHGAPMTDARWSAVIFVTTGVTLQRMVFPAFAFNPWETLITFVRVVLMMKYGVGLKGANEKEQEIIDALRRNFSAISMRYIVHTLIRMGAQIIGGVLASVATYAFYFGDADRLGTPIPGEEMYDQSAGFCNALPPVECMDGCVGNNSTGIFTCTPFLRKSRVMYYEWIGTMVLLTLVVLLPYGRRITQPGEQASPALARGLVYGLLTAIFYNFTSASFNFARNLGPYMFNSMQNRPTSATDLMQYYFGGQILGTLSAAVLVLLISGAQNVNPKQPVEKLAENIADGNVAVTVLQAMLNSQMRVKH